VIEAARLTGCRGVGVDIGGELIALCRSRAKAAGVDERTRFVTQDFSRPDVREATVMLIYPCPRSTSVCGPSFSGR
jgi:cyclopropane fatty-acyl-phospholipid synthase-like methyltransferase